MKAPNLINNIIHHRKDEELSNLNGAILKDDGEKGTSEEEPNLEASNANPGKFVLRNSKPPQKIPQNDKLTPTVSPTVISIIFNVLRLFWNTSKKIGSILKNMLILLVILLVAREVFPGITENLKFAYLFVDTFLTPLVEWGFALLCNLLKWFVSLISPILTALAI